MPGRSLARSGKHVSAHFMIPELRYKYNELTGFVLPITWRRLAFRKMKNFQKYPLCH